jgi:hypothetical protein
MIPVFFSLGVGEVLGISSATSIFIVRYGVEHLPLMYVIQAAGLLLTSLVIADLSGRMKRPRLLRLIYGTITGMVMVNGTMLIFSKFTSFDLWPVFYPILLVSTMVIYFQLAPLIWLIALDICPTQQAKRLFPVLAGSSTIGCIAAGITGKLLAPAGVEIIYFLWTFFLIGGGIFLFKTIKYYVVPLESETKEETSDLKSNISSIFGSKFLLGTLGLLTLIMTLVFVMDYQFNTVALLFYSNEAKLAGFMAIFLAVSNAVAVVIELGFLSRIMSRLGVGNVLLLVTSGLCFSFVLMILFATGSFALGAVFISYLTIKIMVNVLGEPSYQLLFKVVPSKERDGVRFLVEALFVLLGMIFGAALSGMHSNGFFFLKTMSLLALLLSVMTFYIAWKTRQLYLDELIKCIAFGVQDLKEEAGSLIGRFLPETFVSRLFSLLHHPDDRKRTLALEMAQHLEPVTLAPWIDGLIQDSCVDVRISAIKYCMHLDKKHYNQDIVLACLTDDVPEVRAAVLTLLPYMNIGLNRLYDALEDPDAIVAAEAVISLCKTKEDINLKPVFFAVNRFLDQDGDSAAIICRAIGEAKLHDFAPRLLELLDNGPCLRVFACESLGKLQYNKAVPKIISVYAQADAEFHKTADQALIDMGKDCLEILVNELDNCRNLRSWLAIVKALSALREENMVSEILVNTCLNQLKDLETFAVLGSVLRQSGFAQLSDLASLRFREIYELQMEACWSVLASIYDPFVIAKVKDGTKLSDIELKETSFEVLSEGLADKRLASAMLKVLSNNFNTDQIWDLNSAKLFLKKAPAWNDHWLNEIALAALSSLEGESIVEEQEVLSLLDRIILLKNNDIFSCLQLEELGILARFASLDVFPENKELIKQGTSNSKLFVIIKGNVELSASGSNNVTSTIAVLGSGKAVGESSVFDEGVSPVTAEVILGEASVLTIDVWDIKRLCSLYPGIAQGFIKSMSQRIRKLEQMIITMA